MKEWIISLMNRYGYIGLFSFMLLENIFPPIPSEVILTISGYMIHHTSFQYIGIVVISTLGSYIGNCLLYGLGRLCPIERFFQTKIARILHFKEEHVIKSQNWFCKYERKAVFFGRFIPIVRSFISIPAGIHHMSFVVYSLYTIVGTLIWNGILVGVGYYLAEEWSLVIDYMKQYKLLIIGAVIIYIIYSFIKNKKTPD